MLQSVENPSNKRALCAAAFVFLKYKFAAKKCKVEIIRCTFPVKYCSFDPLLSFSWLAITDDCKIGLKVANMRLFFNMRMSFCDYCNGFVCLMRWWIKIRISLKIYKDRVTNKETEKSVQKSLEYCHGRDNRSLQ